MTYKLPEELGNERQLEEIEKMLMMDDENEKVDLKDEKPRRRNMTEEEAEKLGNLAI